MEHEDSNMALDVYSSGLPIEPLVESINKLTYGEEVDSFIKEAISKELNGEANDKITDMELLAKLQTNWRAQTFSTPYRFYVGTNGSYIFHHHTIFLNGDDFKIEEKIWKPFIYSANGFYPPSVSFLDFD